MIDDPLTPDETTQLRELLRRNQIENESVRVVQQLPGLGRFLGKIGKYVVYAVGLKTILEVLLLPLDVEQAYTFYQPKAAWAVEQVTQALASMRRSGLDPNSLPPSSDYIAFGAPILPTTTTTPDPSVTISVTVVSSTGIPPQVFEGSGIVPPPSSWT